MEQLTDLAAREKLWKTNSPPSLYAESMNLKFAQVREGHTQIHDKLSMFEKKERLIPIVKTCSNSYSRLFDAKSKSGNVDDGVHGHPPGNSSGHHFLQILGGSKDSTRKKGWGSFANAIASSKKGKQRCKRRAVEKNKSIRRCNSKLGSTYLWRAGPEERSGAAGSEESCGDVGLPCFMFLIEVKHPAFK